MINTEKYNKVLDAGLLLDHFALLCCIRDNQAILKNKRIVGFQNLLCKKGFILNNNLTEKALNLVGEEQLTGFSKSIVSIEKTTVTTKDDYADWIIKLHKKCKDKLIELTGKGQVRDSISNKSYSFLPNSTDLGKVLLRVIQSYKLTDFDRIEKTILAYIDRCATGKNWFPILQYYIWKNGASTMVTEMEFVDENTKADDSIVNI